MAKLRTLTAAVALALSLGGAEALVPGLNLPASVQNPFVSLPTGFKPTLPPQLPPIPANLPSVAQGAPGLPGGLPALPPPPAWNNPLLNNYRPSKARLAYRQDTGMAVSWSTPKQLPVAAVLYGQQPNQLNRISTSTNSVTYNTSTYYSNHVVLDNLKPNTKYYYLSIFGDPTKDLRSFTTAL